MSKYRGKRVTGALAQIVAQQRFDEWYANQSHAFRQGWCDAKNLPSHRRRDPYSHEFCDHKYNPFVTRSTEWSDYCAGVVAASEGDKDD